MEKAGASSDTARKAVEAAQPLSENTTTRGKIMQKKIVFEESIPQSSEVSSSQDNSSYKAVLSQPAPGLSHKQRLLWQQKRRGPGLWVQCDDCDKWRFLPHVLDRHELPDKWYCRLHPDRSQSDCSVSEAPILLRDEEDLIHSEYSAGSVVWARLAGWPWWPAMVDDCPDTEQFYWIDGFSDIPTHYNVTFFDKNEVTRAWITPQNLKPYNSNKKGMRKYVLNQNKKYKDRIEAALKQADDADMLPIANRLAKYSFIARFKGTIGSPKKIIDAELKKFKNTLKRRLNIDFSEESESESEGSTEKEITSVKNREEMKNKNIILVGTPKRTKTTKRTADRADKENNDIITIDDGRSSIDKNKSSSEKQLEAMEETIKEPADSLVVQVGSTSLNETTGIDNDSSRTYLPDSEVNDSADILLGSEFQVRIATPSSDDFDF